MTPGPQDKPVAGDRWPKEQPPMSPDMAANALAQDVTERAEAQRRRYQAIDPQGWADLKRKVFDLARMAQVDLPVYGPDGGLPTSRPGWVAVAHFSFRGYYHLVCASCDGTKSQKATASRFEGLLRQVWRRFRDAPASVSDQMPIEVTTNDEPMAARYVQALMVAAEKLTGAPPANRGGEESNVRTDAPPGAPAGGADPGRAG